MVSFAFILGGVSGFEIDNERKNVQLFVLSAKVSIDM